MLPRTQGAVKSASLSLGRQSPIKGFVECWESFLGVLRLATQLAIHGEHTSMGVPPMTVVPKKTPAIQIAVPTLFPLFIVAFAAEGTMMFGERYGMDVVPFALVGWCIVLFGCAAWLNQVLFRRTKTFLPFLAAVVAILLTWLWQKHAFAMLIPRAGLTCGYFLKPDGINARHWVLTYPLWTGLVCLSACFVGALVSGWAAGARRSLVCLLPWWVAAFLVFALPSMYLDAQGNASVFI
jgi:hypothetical protein